MCAGEAPDEKLKINKLWPNVDVWPCKTRTGKGWGYKAMQVAMCMRVLMEKTKV